MKTLFISILFILIIFSQNISLAQNDEAPKYTQEEYEKMIPSVIKAINWLESNAVDKDIDNRKKLNEFVILWATGYHGVSIEIRDYINDFSKIDINFLMVFMGGWIKYELANKDEGDKIKLNAAGLKSIIKLYSQGGIEKNDFIESLIKKNNSGELNDYIKEKLEAK